MSECPAHDIGYCLEPLNQMTIARESALYESINRMLLYHVTPKSADEAYLVENIFSDLVHITNDPIARIINANYAQNYLMAEAGSAKFNFFTQRVCVLEETTLGSRHISNVLAGIKFNIYDLLLKNAGAPQRRLPEAPVSKSFASIGRYPVIIMDRMKAPEHLAEFDKLHSARIIGHDHSPWDYLFKPVNESLLLFRYENLLARPWLIRRKSMPSHNFDQLLASSSRKCEIAYTGNYSREFRDPSALYRPEIRKELRSRIEQKFGKKLRQDAPLVFCITSASLDMNEIAAGLNSLSKFCDIVYRPSWREINTITNMLDKNIILDDLWGQALDANYQAADMILADVDKGSFLGSLMQGLMVLPLRSKKVCGLPWADFREKMLDYKTERPALKRVLELWAHIPEIGDTEELLKAITGNFYRQWYKDNLQYLQRMVFGDYLRENAASKTAEYIVRFINDGTLGNQCDALWLGSAGSNLPPANSGD